MKMTREFKSESIKLVVGLGNPGTQYDRTYHNAGRRVVVALAGTEEKKFKSSPAFLSHKGVRLVFALPRTFMNESGAAVKSALRSLKVKPHEMVLVHDDADLPLGSYRLVFARGAAGHHGVESVIQTLGTNEFWRLRVGIRPPAFLNKKADTFVLRPIPRNAQDALATITETFRAILLRKPA